MKKNKRQRMVAALACILALLLLLPMVLMVVTNLSSAGAASSSSIRQSINQLKNKNKDLASQKAELNSQLKAIRADKSQALSKKAVLEQQINVLQDSIQNLEDQITQYDLLIAEKEQEVAENQAAEERQFDRFCKQVRLMEEEGTVSYWSILFSADSFTDLLDRVSLVNDIADYNQKVCDELVAAREALQAAQAELEGAQAEAQQAKTEQESARAELKSQEAEVDALIKEIVEDEAKAKSAIDDLNAAADAMDKEIAKREKELEAAIAEERRRAEQNGTQSSYTFDPGTGFYWPLPSNRVTITSFFGYRSDPFTGKSSNHYGTDIAAPKGTEIYSAHGGVVLTSTYNGSYGNYVVVSRGDGTNTLYAHMSKRAVSAGQTVSQGQVIGYVGSTGRSTAPHLHFEVRVNGVRGDILKYYPNLNWINHTGYEYK